MTIKTNIRKAINKALAALGNYHDSIPLQQIFDALKAHNVIVVDEAGEPWSGLLCGRDSHTTFDLQLDGAPVKNAALFLSWYKMPSGRYEITVYLS